MKQNSTNLMFMLIIYGKTQRNFEKKTSVFACESCNQTAIKPKTQTRTKCCNRRFVSYIEIWICQKQKKGILSG